MSSRPIWPWILLKSLLFLSSFFSCHREYLTLGLIIQANSIADSGILFDVALTHSAMEVARAFSCLLPAAIFTVPSLHLPQHHHFSWNLSGEFSLSFLHPCVQPLSDGLFLRTLNRSFLADRTLMEAAWSYCSYCNRYENQPVRPKGLRKIT